MVGQPRFVGDPIFEETTVRTIRETQNEHPNIPIDLFYGMWEYDAMNQEIINIRKHNLNWAGLPISGYRNDNPDTVRNYQAIAETFYKDPGSLALPVIPKIRAKKEKFEKWLKEKFSFINSVTVTWHNPYDLAHNVSQRLQKYIINNPDIFDATDVDKIVRFTDVSWLNQHLIIDLIYNENKEYFDKLDHNSVIFKCRPDLAIPIHNKEHWEGMKNGNLPYTIWNMAGILLEGSVTSKIHPSLDENIDQGIYADHNESWYRFHCYPKVVYNSMACELIRGQIFGTDFVHTMDVSAFKIYATRFVDWMFENPRIRLAGIGYPYGLEKNGYVDPHYQLPWSILEAFKAKPEVVIHSFFAENECSMISTASRPEHFKEPAWDRTRVFFPEELDLHRWRWYEWDKELVETLFMFDETKVPDENVD
tara:strand:+ start:2914 stop:4176 length:1263 start_codon:yes stop_codon:yes gene_type:complete